MSEKFKPVELAELEKLKTGLVCLSIVAKRHEIDTSPEQLMHGLGIEQVGNSEDEILRAAGSINLKVKPMAVTWKRLAKITWPALAQLNNGQYVAILSAADDKVSFFDPFRPQSTFYCSQNEFEQAWNGKIILAKTTGGNAQERKFGLSWFAAEIARHRPILIEIFSAALAVQLFGLVTPLFSQIVIDKVVVHHNISILHVLGIGMIILIAFEAILSSLQTYLMTHTASRIDVILGSRVMRHLLRLPLRYFESRQIGVVVAHMRELENVRQFITGASIGAVLDGVSIFAIVPLMFLYSATLSWIALAAIPFFIVSSLCVVPLMRSRLEKKFEYGALNQSFLVESISGIHTIKSLAIEPIVGRKWGRLLADYVSASYRANLLGGLSGSLGQFLQKISSLTVLWAGANLVISGELSVGNLVAFQMLSARLIQPIVRIAQLWQEFQQVQLSIARIGDIMHNLPETRHSALSMARNRVRGSVEFSNVDFRYSDAGKPILSDVSFTVRPGQTIGIVGRSGSGKSTLTKLLQCMYLPHAGKIAIDDVDTRTLDPAYLRSQIGVVLQENFLFDGTVRSNIAINNPAAPADRIVYVAKAAGAHEFIMSLPLGYDTPVGERGVSLSGGQRQRIAIARALLNNPSILIFDEATSALDYESERIIQTNMEEICKGRTVFLIAHRLSTVVNADAILVMDQGTIVEHGRHHELLARQGMYSHLFSQQAVLA